jgi:(1->4)-alpha-D-glucan 1-alpha-D-glucosylmutase
MSRIPAATYRLQLNRNFTFADAEKVLDYLVALGISHVYLSPIRTSRKGSTHGYDVTDPTQVDPELGGEAALEHFQSELRARGLGLIVDVVPNHMAASSENRWWMDVLENGPASAYASYFDVAWRRSDGSEGKVMLPFLAETFGEALDRGLLKLSFSGSQLFVAYNGQSFPLSPSTYPDVLGRNLEVLKGALPHESPELSEFEGIVAAARAIQAAPASGNGALRTQFHALRGRIQKLVSGSPMIAAFIENNVEELNGARGDAVSVSALERILAAQHYSLAYWRTSGDEINYRRFFSIDDLVGVRVEDPEVFEAMHAVLARLNTHEPHPGLRVDHIDGLHDPLAYLQKLSQFTRNDNESGYLVVEKILAQGESLPRDWPVDGTTGYDFLNESTRVFVDDANAQAMEQLYREWTGEHESFDDVAYAKKMFVMRELFRVEMRSLGRELANLARDDRYAREVDSSSLREALIEITACLKQYRTYVRSVELSSSDHAAIEAAVRDARKRNKTIDRKAVDFARDVLLLSPLPHVRPEQREAWLAFVMRWQQFTGPITAKGLEDTALYNYFPLSALNEVGGDPMIKREDAALFAQFVEERRKHWPHSMNASTTHDTKRSEDARARIAVLSEIPSDWRAALDRWSEMNRKWAVTIVGEETPDRNEEYLLYQTLIATWPLDTRRWGELVARLQEYVVKAGREAKVHTRWVKPNLAREAALQKFVASVLDRTSNADFVNDFAQFQRLTADYGMLNGLSQTLLKLACPGVPDFYQGSEAWDFRLVDPDNRAPVCFKSLRTQLDHAQKVANRGDEADLESMVARWHDGRIKLHLIESALAFRRTHSKLFDTGAFQELAAQGEHAHRTFAFQRSFANESAVIVIPRCVASLKAPLDRAGRAKFWANTTIEIPNAAADWTNVLAPGAQALRTQSGRIALGDVFVQFPVALLTPVA